MREKSLATDASARLGTSEAKLKRAVESLGEGLGPPWRQDQKLGDDFPGHYNNLVWRLATSVTSWFGVD